MGLSIIISTHNRQENLLSLTDMLIDFTNGSESEIIVVNDVAGQDLSEILNEKIICLENQKGGVAASRNLGAKNSAFENLLFLDDDMLVTKEAITAVNNFFSIYQSAVLNVNWNYPEELVQACRKTNFGRYLLEKGHTSLRGWMNNQNWRENDLYEVPGLGSAFLAIRKNDFLAVGGYNENFPHAGFEDHEFSTRLVASGTKVYLNTRISVFHNEAENIQVNNWLNRKYKNAFTRGIGVSALNYNDMKLDYSGLKSTVFKIIYMSRGFYMGMLRLISRSAHFKALYHKLFDKLHGAYLYAGYTAGLKSVKK